MVLINVSISFSIGKHHPLPAWPQEQSVPLLFQDQETLKIMFVLFLSISPAFIDALSLDCSHTVGDTWELRSWLRRQHIPASFLPSLTPSGRAGSTDALLNLDAGFTSILSLSPHSVARILAPRPAGTCRGIWVECHISHVTHGTHGASSHTPWEPRGLWPALPSHPAAFSAHCSYTVLLRGCLLPVFHQC